MTFLIDNKYSFVNIKPKKSKILIAIILIIILIFIMLVKIKAYDSYEAKGYVTCNDSCTILTYIPTNINYDKIYYKHREMVYETINTEVKVDEKNLESYLELTITTKESLRNGEIIYIDFYYQKQRLISKIKNLMF